MVAMPPRDAKRSSLQAHVLSRRMSRTNALLELWAFLRERKKYWLMPIVFCLVLVSLLMLASQSSAIAPFIYTLF